jgi:UDP-N-acetylmuramoyl-L-alanyl-D-glutamate--2,6-diaminopimelate ligase
MKPIFEMMAELARSASAVIQDSRQARAGAIFFAIRGTASDGHEHVPAVLKAGASACVVATDYRIPGGLDASIESRLVRVPDTREAFAWACSAFHGHPSRSLLMVGVTGTSGKTTTTYLIESILRAAGHRVGVIGTVNFRIGDRILPSTHTTPGSDELQKLLAEMKQEGCTAVVMEVSSHALKQHRTKGIAFDAMVFTNLSREHLDYHPDMQDYFESKKLLFTHYAQDSREACKSPKLVVNADDQYGSRLAKELGSEAWSFSLGHDPAARVLAQDLALEMEGTTASVLLQGTDALVLRTPLVARFNAQNALAAAAAALSLGVSPRQIEVGLLSLEGVPGRLEKVPNAAGLNILVDYAHKPDALEKVLHTLRDLRRPGQRILTVVGCGGDRDRTKRPVMGRLAETLSDLAIVTSDNPRTENPESIIEEILAGISDRTRVIVRADRREAIHEAVRTARPGDLILIAGKGHEDYQIIADPAARGGTRKIHFDDREVAAEACAELGKIS